jgi:hypothetical protein
MASARPPLPARSPAQDRWDAWQATSVSQRLLPRSARQEGYTVVRVPPPLRSAFLDIAQVLRLYDRLCHKARRVLSAKQLACLVALSDATQALLAALQEEAHD